MPIKYKHVRREVHRWCEILKKYVPDVLCSRSRDAKDIAKLLNSIYKREQELKSRTESIKLKLKRKP